MATNQQSHHHDHNQGKQTGRTVTIGSQQPDHNPETIIIHADGGYYSDQDIAIGGFTVKDNRGNELRTCWEYIPDGENNMDAEALAIESAIDHADHFNPSYLVVRTDCDTLIPKINPDTPVQTLTSGRNQTVIQNIHHRIRKKLSKYEFLTVKSTKREMNKRADELVNRGKRHMLI